MTFYQSPPLQFLIAPSKTEYIAPDLSPYPANLYSSSSNATTPSFEIHSDYKHCSYSSKYLASWYNLKEDL